MSKDEVSLPQELKDSIPDGWGEPELRQPDVGEKVWVHEKWLSATNMAQGIHLTLRKLNPEPSYELVMREVCSYMIATKPFTHASGVRDAIGDAVLGRKHVVPCPLMVIDLGDGRKVPLIMWQLISAHVSGGDIAYSLLEGFFFNRFDSIAEWLWDNDREDIVAEAKRIYNGDNT